MPEQDRKIHTPSRLLPTLAAGLFVAAGCIGGSSAIKGEIRDDRIILATDHAGSAVRFELHNSGTLACDIVLVLTELKADALPVKDGLVVIAEGDGPGHVRPDGTYETQPPYTLGHVLPGADFSQEIAMEGAPKADDRVLLCNGVGDYQHGRFAPLRFDR